MAFIRPLLLPQDEESIIHVFRETAALDLRQAGDPALSTASLIWARPYLFLSSSHCFVLDDGNGKVVGYILGVRDTKEFVKEYRKLYLPWLEGEGRRFMTDVGDGVGSMSRAENGDEEMSIHGVMRSIVYQPELMLNAEVPNLVREYPAHLHIDIMDGWQRKGWGKKLIGALCDKLRGEDVKGLHLGMVGTNHGAVRFYENLGFRRFDGIMDGGASGEVGRARDGGLWMVKRLVDLE